MENIYEDFGTIITSNRYIKRELENSIINRIDGKYFGSYSLVGLHRIGKSTLLYHISKKFENEIVINLTLSSFPSVEKFFNKFLKEIYKILKKQNLLDDDIIEVYENYKEADKDELSEYFLEFLEEVVFQTDKKIIVIIDEFDYATKLFKETPHLFQIIREIGIMNERYKTAFIFSSRRLIEEIEIKLDGISNLANVLKIGYLKLYSKKEIEKYFNQLSNYFEITQDLISFYEDITGFYPYLMDILSNSLVNECEILNNNILNDIYDKYINKFYEHYEKIKNLLIEENLFDELLQVVFKMPFDIKPIKLQRLINYGIIDEQGVVFSKSFEEFLLAQKGMSDYHKVWNKTEKGLKNLSKDIYFRNYGKKWEIEIKEKYKNNQALNNLIYNAYKYKNLEKRLWNYNKQNSFLDTISTSGLLFLIEEEWHYFSDIFGKSLDYWREIFKPLKNVRNVIQHNRENILSNTQISQVILYCEEINQIIDEYFKGNK